ISYQIFQPEKNNKYLNNEQLIQYIKEIKKLEEDCIGLFVFDNSPTHLKYAKDALIAKRIRSRAT
ncbi:13590_t:CDS:1, partial [Racocetra fulgida]